MDIANYLAEKASYIEKYLDQLIVEKNVAYQNLYKAARYSLLGGGKRIRPILTLATAETFGATAEKAIIPACAIEMIHTYSLIHDDLPSMDDDDFRRGKPSLHKAFPEGHAVLTGDFLLTYAFEAIAITPSLTPEQKVRLIALLATSAGGDGMIGGQVMDLEAENVVISLDTLKEIHNRKTGAMITASVVFGGIIAGIPSNLLSLIHQFGAEIGLIFQIVDDILDVTESKQKHGKALSSDQINHKSTYVTLLGLEPSKKLAQSLLTSAINRLNQIPYDTSLLKKLAEFVVNRTT